MSKVKCSYCGEELTEEYYACYYADECDSNNILCGEGECWAEWMQDNTWGYTIEKEEKTNG